MKKVYIASPYTVGNSVDNVNIQIDAADELISLGFAPHVPLLSHYIHLRYPRHYVKWLDLDFEWIKQCDYLLRLPGESKGADMEVEHARSLSIPVFYKISDLTKESKIEHN